jgi:hypothetical protein
VAALERPNVSRNRSADGLPAPPSRPALGVAIAIVTEIATANVSPPTVAPASRAMFPGANGFARAIWASGPIFFPPNRNGRSATPSSISQPRPDLAPAT